jgi:hypothetical protein
LWLYRGDLRNVAEEPDWEVFSGRASAVVDFEAAAGALEAG